MRDGVIDLAGWLFEIVKRSDDTKDFVVLSRRCLVKRILGWPGRYPHLSKDYEQWPETSQSMPYAAMVRLMLKRLAPNPALWV